MAQAPQEVWRWDGVRPRPAVADDKRIAPQPFAYLYPPIARLLARGGQMGLGDRDRSSIIRRQAKKEEENVDHAGIVAGLDLTRPGAGLGIGDAPSCSTSHSAVKQQEPARSPDPSLAL